jgi:hypothetical protein
MVRGPNLEIPGSLASLIPRNDGQMAPPFTIQPLLVCNNRLSSERDQQKRHPVLRSIAL